MCLKKSFLSQCVVLLVITWLICAGDLVKAQSSVDREAKFPGGDQALVQWVSKHLVFPEEARMAGLNGELKVLLLVDTLGKTSVIGFVGDTLGFGCERAIRQMVRKMPLWIPAIADGVKVPYENILPIRFNFSPPKKEEVEYFKQAQTMPSFKGGELALLTYIDEALKRYSSARSGQKGQVVVEFFIEKDGSIGQCWVSQTSNENLNDLALRITREMPVWNPGSIYNEPVRVLRSLTLDFD